MSGIAILSIYGLITTIGGIVALRRRGSVNIPRTQVAVFTIIGLAVIAASILSLKGSLGLVWLIFVSLASLLSRVWNGVVMGRVHATHLIFFGGVLALGIALTQT